GYFFFFQAEAGIRDYKVTGVQTCALPISGSVKGKLKDRDFRKVRLFHEPGNDILDAVHFTGVGNEGESRDVTAQAGKGPGQHGEIGRASCRGRATRADSSRALAGIAHEIV